MKYIIIAKNPFLRDLPKYGHYETEDARDAAEWIIDHSNMEEEYDNMLDECYPEIDICGYSYSASVALYRVDPTAYSCGKSDYEDSRAEDIAYDIDRMDDGEEEDYYDYEVHAVDEAALMDEEEEETETQKTA